MPYDPTLPLPNSPLESAVIRDQLQSLFNLINSIDAINAAQVDAVSTLDPGEPATASVAVSASSLLFTFGIPRGEVGLQGNDGSDGDTGPPFANAVVDSVTTLPAGSPATVGVSFDGTLVHFTFSIPAGLNGANGLDGIQGIPGEVTNAALAMSISGTSANTNSVSMLDTAFADPDMEALRAKMNELILNGRR